MFNSLKSSDKDSFLKQTEASRQQRQLEKKKINGVVKIQACYRGYRARKALSKSLCQEIKDELDSVRDENGQIKLKLTPIKIYILASKFIYLSKQTERENKLRQSKANASKAASVSGSPPQLAKPLLDNSIYERFFKYLLMSIKNGDLKNSYMSLILSKQNYQNFINQASRVLKLCLNQMKQLNLKDVNEHKSLTTYLSFLITKCDYKLWNCFDANKNELLAKLLNETSKSFLSSIKSFGVLEIFHKILMQNYLNHHPIVESKVVASMINLSFKILETQNYQSSTIIEFCSHILIIPTLVHSLNENVEKSAPNDLIRLVMVKFRENDLTSRIFSTFSTSEMAQVFLNGKDLNQSICFLANLCSLAQLDMESLKLNIEIFIIICLHIFEHCSDILISKNKNPNKLETPVTSQEASSSGTITYHPLFGYLKLRTSQNYSNSLMTVYEQLKFLWSHQFISLLFDSKNLIVDNVTPANFKEMVRNKFEKLLKNNSKQSISQVLNQPEAQSIYRVCTFYRRLLQILSEPRMEILSALSIEEEFILGLWKFISHLGNCCGLKELVKLVEIEKSFKHPIFDLLYLLSNLVLYLVTIFDETEFYENQKILSLNDYKALSTFLNSFLYQILSSELIDLKTLESNKFFAVFHQLLIVLYSKDNQRSFTNNKDFWIIKEIKIKNFMNDLEKERLSTLVILDKLPHVIPLKYRIEILQNKIEKDKQAISGGDSSHVKVKIRRNKLVEDGYMQLSSLPISMFKSVIRVIFVNEYGLNEAGIDQDGVFKEFLQDIIKQLLNTNFNLFQVTTDQQLYPSPSSYFVDDHLQLIEFIGKLVGKVIYEGLVVDIEFAPFFLRQIIGVKNSNYSFLDDLVTLDKEMCKNLNSIKHEDNVDALELNFTHSEYHLGKLVTHELIPSGSLIKVTNENKIRYIHLMAHFKLHKQIKQQIFAFNEGFKSVIKQDWLNMFSIPEVQRLISGSLQDIDFEDLKKNVQYWGGLHSNHRLIKWLWEILEFEFTKEERSLFLKFVTSCSKPPLMGFSSLNPPFTIRCVETEEEEGTIYDASFKGFFKTIMNIGGSNDTIRLPTSSTCFNLLKLPNYSKKSTLKEKLRYAIQSNSGFELS